MKSNFATAALAAILPILAAAGSAPAQTVAPAHEKTAAEFSITYAALHSNASVGDCGCFWMRGGSAEIAVPIWRHLSGVGEISGEHAASLPGDPGVELNLTSGLGGLRFTHPYHQRWSPFGQALFGGVHGYDSYFPATAGPKTYASSFAMATGLGLNVRLKKHLLLRPIQADYHYTQLPNNAVNPANRQHNIRLSAGIVFRISR